MKNFNDIYEEIYNSSGKDLSKLKKRNFIRNVLLFIIVIIFGIIGIITNYAPIFLIFVITLLITMFILIRQFVLYKSQYKEKIIKKFVKEYSENLEYYPKKGILPIEYNAAGFEKYYNCYHSEDLIEGKILDDCKIKMAEVHIQQESKSIDSEGHTTTTYINLFRGLFAKIDLNNFSNLNFKIVKNELFKGKKRLEMDSGEFEKIYDVITDDKIGTLRIITSDVMQELIEFKDRSKVVPEIALINNVLYIRFAVGNVFEPNMFKDDMDFDNLKKNYDMINFIFKLTEDISRHILEFEE